VSRQLGKKGKAASREQSELMLVSAETLPNRGKIRALPKELREDLDRRLMDSGFRDYRGLARWLKSRGYTVSHAALHKYGSKFERRLEAVKLATAQARAIVAASPEDDTVIAEGLMRLVQSSLFQVLVDLEAVKREQKPNLMPIAKTVASLARASVMQQKWNAEIRARLADKVGAVRDKVSEAEREAGLSARTAETIRQALLDIKV